jgi:hypothetical protein
MTSPPDARLPRLRQIALVAADLDAATTRIEAELGLKRPFHDPGVAEFGLTNAVYELGDTFLEVVSPTTDNTTAARYLERRGGDAGYMALFQVHDTNATRAHAASLGLRVVWQLDLPDISGTHLHPRDIGGAIVSFDTPTPPESWRWAGPRWTGGAPADIGPNRITGIVVRAVAVDTTAKVWTELFTDRQVRFDPVDDPRDQGIAVVEIEGLAEVTTICGVRFRPSA